MLLGSTKPLGRRAYGSIGHLPGSRLGPGDHHVPQGQADICCKQARSGDLIVVEEKLDGSCCAVARVGHNILALTRAGYLASTSPHEQHWLFAAWVLDNHHTFVAMLNDGERVVGEWIAQAHGTDYDCDQPFWVFDLIDAGNNRVCRQEFHDRVYEVATPHEVHRGGAVPVDAAWHLLLAEEHAPASYLREGLVYRVERKGRVEFMAKWVHPRKIDGLFLPEVSGRRAVWNWGPRSGSGD